MTAITEKGADRAVVAPVSTATGSPAESPCRKRGVVALSGSAGSGKSFCLARELLARMGIEWSGHAMPERESAD